MLQENQVPASNIWQLLPWVITALCLALTPVLKVCSSDIDAVSPLIEPLRMADTQQCRTKHHSVLSSAAATLYLVFDRCVACFERWLRQVLDTSARR